MKATIAITNPNEVEATISITLKLKDWLKCRQLIAEGMINQWPLAELTSAIVSLSLTLNEQDNFTSEDKKEERVQ